MCPNLAEKFKFFILRNIRIGRIQQAADRVCRIRTFFHIFQRLLQVTGIILVPKIIRPEKHCIGAGIAFFRQFFQLWNTIFKVCFQELFFCGLAFSILWALILLLASGAVSFTADAFFASLARDHTPLAIYLLAASLAAFALFAIDKRQAVHAGSRIPEAVLLGVGLAGGAPGALLGMHLFHHKTRRAYFRWGLWLFLAIDALLIVLFMAEGIL